MKKVKALLILAVIFKLNISHSLDERVIENIKSNTFIIVPINTYAPSIEEEQARQYYTQNCQAEMTSPRLQLNCSHLENCSGEDCSVPFKPHGTAFLLENGTQLLTAWHVLFSSHSAGLFFLQNHLAANTLEERQERVLSTIKPAFVLLNHNKEIVYDTRQTPSSYKMIGDPLAPVFHHNGRDAENFYGYHENIPTDWTIVDLPQAFGHGLKLASNFDLNTDEFYNAGFGFDRYNMNFTLSSGYRESIQVLNQFIGLNSFYTSREEKTYEELSAMEIPEILSYMGYSNESISAQMQEYSEEVIQNSIDIVLRTQQRHQRDLDIELRSDAFFLTAASLPGHSGCPLLNDQGEVVGLISTGFSRSQNEESPITAFGSGALIFKNSEIIDHLDY